MSHSVVGRRRRSIAFSSSDHRQPAPSKTLRLALSRPTHRPRRGQFPLGTTQLTGEVSVSALALLLRNPRAYLLPLLRRSRPTCTFVGRTFSSGSDEVPFRSPTGLGTRNGESSEKGKLDEGIASLFTGANTPTAPPRDTDGTGSGLREVPEEGEEGFDYENAEYGLVGRNHRMTQDIKVTFLGTSSGGGPTRTRNCSSLIVDMLGDGTLWMVDCAEGTTRQFEMQPPQPPAPHRVRRGKVNTIFVTHMHADHIMGLIGFLKAQLGIPRAGIRPVVKLELYGPAGLRAFIRTILNMTDSKCQDKYVVHELLRHGEQPSAPCTSHEMRENEAKGRDIVCGEDGYWRECLRVWSNRARRDIVVDVGQVVHRVTCLGYVIRESPMSWDVKGNDEAAKTARLRRLRKLVLLGDTNDPDEILPLVTSSPGHVALAVHESTDCYIPTQVDPQQKTGKNRSVDSVRDVSLQRGHSTPYMAGKFAKEIGARRLVLNHLGARFPAPGRSGNGDNNLRLDATDLRQASGVVTEGDGYSAPRRGENREDRFRGNVMAWIEQQATEAWDPEEEGARAWAAFDFLTVCIKPIPVPGPSYPETGEVESQTQWTQPSSSANAGQGSGDGTKYR